MGSGMSEEEMNRAKTGTERDKIPCPFSICGRRLLRRHEYGHCGRGTTESLYFDRVGAQRISSPATPHSLRHTAATRLYEASGGDLILTREFLGHASVQTTAIYAHTSREKIQKAVEKM